MGVTLIFREGSVKIIQSRGGSVLKSVEGGKENDMVGSAVWEGGISCKLKVEDEVDSSIYVGWQRA